MNKAYATVSRQFNLDGLQGHMNIEQKWANLYKIIKLKCTYENAEFFSTGRRDILLGLYGIS